MVPDADRDVCPCIRVLLSVFLADRLRELGSKERIRLMKKRIFLASIAAAVLFAPATNAQKEILKNLTPELLTEIKRLSRGSLSEMAKLFQEGIGRQIYIEAHPHALADIVWALFSGVVLWENSKRVINEDKDYLKETLETAFEIFGRGIRK